MTKSLPIMIFLFSCSLVPALAQVDDPIAKKVGAAKETFYADRDKAEKQLLEALTRFENSFKQKGDLKSLETIRAEITAFRNEGTVPKIVPVREYETAMKLARAKLENAYLAGIKSYTQADKLDLAKELQKTLDEFKQSAKPAADPQDFFQPKTSWTNEKRTTFLTVTERKGDDFKANYLVYAGNSKTRMVVTGKIKNGTFLWEGKDAIDTDGKPSIMNVQGVLRKDEAGNKIDFLKFDPKTGYKESHVLAPNKP